MGDRGQDTVPGHKGTNYSKDPSSEYWYHKTNLLDRKPAIPLESLAETDVDDRGCTGTNVR